MTRTAKSTLVMAVAAVVFVGATYLGWGLLTADATIEDAGPTCTDRHVAEGEPLTANLVQVNVLNSSGREGLANRVSINLQRLGFLAGTVANSESELAVDHVAIFTDDPEDPMVQLVAVQFQVQPQIVPPDVPIEAEGVTVAVGPGFDQLKPESATEIAATRPVDVCVPIGDL